MTSGHPGRASLPSGTASGLGMGFEVEVRLGKAKDIALFKFFVGELFAFARVQERADRNREVRDKGVRCNTGPQACGAAGSE